MEPEERKRLEFHVSEEDIKAGLRKLGLKRGDILGVHSSLGSFGYVEGGADAVIDALLEVVGEEGTIVMPTHSTNLAEVKRTPEEIAIGVAWLYKILRFDPKETPCTTGIIPETFRKRRGVRRSLHPVVSLAAAGPKAGEIIEAGREGALEGWEKLLEWDGYILLIGVGLEVCTAMHLAERRVQFPKRILKKITPPQWFVEKYPASEWEWDFGPYPDFAKLEEPCLERGIMKIIKVREATLRLVRLRELIDLYVEYQQRSPDLFYGKKEG
jgi:aminoglycoside 3-N-acetyltransferase